MITLRLLFLSLLALILSLIMLLLLLLPNDEPWICLILTFDELCCSLPMRKLVLRHVLVVWISGCLDIAGL